MNYIKRVNVLGYNGKIAERRHYYVDFTNEDRKHWVIVNLLKRRLNKIYHRKDDILSYLAHKLDLVDYSGYFPEFNTIEELKIFVNYLNKLNLIFIK